MRKERNVSIDEKDFELLAILNETRNITRASYILYITQSALSKRIKAIEKDLGTEIMIRSRQGIRFTPAGETVLARSAAAAKESEAMRRHLYKQMLDGSLDLAVLRGEYIWDGVQFLLSQENICLVCDKEHKDMPLSDYLYISHKTDISQSALVSRWMHEHQLDPRSHNFCVDSISTCLEMIKLGLGWGLIPEIALDHFDGCRIPCTFKDGEPFIRRTYILCQREAVKLPQVVSFMDMLKANR